MAHLFYVFGVIPWGDPESLSRNLLASVSTLPHVCQSMENWVLLWVKTEWSF